MVDAILEPRTVAMPIPASRVARVPEWKPTLDASDLACLLHVIENDLLPRLVGAYAPSRHSPLPTSRG